ncbi:hypothetical protein Barb7_00746 [Bacteroidales bacterium Barb7]|nr:hypothetical protein Barb7_00746 [Bacteroidales bacterium Barb7]
MKVLLDIPDAKAPFLMDVLQHIKKPATLKIFLMNYNVKSIDVFEKQAGRLIKNMLLSKKNFGN